MIPETTGGAPVRTDGPVVQLTVDGGQVEVPDDGGTLLDALREVLGIRSVKDGCSPQGQCGCCTVLVDGSPRVACVTPVRRVAGRTVTTLDGIDDDVRAAWADAFSETGASQCGFCTPGIVVRLEGLRSRSTGAGAGAGVGSGEGAGPDDPVGPGGAAGIGVPAVERALQAHLCRCTGWRTILDAVAALEIPRRAAARPARDLAAAAQRAGIEGGSPQQVGPDVALGRAGFAADTAPADALVAVPDGRGGWSVGESLAEARLVSGKVQGRRTTAGSLPPIELPPGDWDVTLRTSWVEPAYLETDASWCSPGGEPATPLANGGAFGGKSASPVPAVARELADRHGRPVRVVLSREDSVRMGPKRPPLAAGVRRDGSGVVRVVRTPGVADRIRLVAPGLVVEELDVAGPPTSVALRAAGWAEAAVLLAALGSEAGRIHDPAGGWAEASVETDGSVHVRVGCGLPLDEVVVRSFAIGAAHMAIGWVTSEALAVDVEGQVHDLTIRSFGVLRAVDTPPIAVEVAAEDGPPVIGSDAVFAAVAAAVWRHQGFPPAWPTKVPLRR